MYWAVLVRLRNLAAFSLTSRVGPFTAIIATYGGTDVPRYSTKVYKAESYVIHYLSYHL